MAEVRWSRGDKQRALNAAERVDRLAGRIRDLERSVGRLHQLLAELRTGEGRIRDLERSVGRLHQLLAELTGQRITGTMR